MSNLWSIRKQLEEIKHTDLRRNQPACEIARDMYALGMDMHRRADLLNGTGETGLQNNRRMLAVSMLALSDAIRMGALHQ